MYVYMVSLFRFVKKRDTDNIIMHNVLRLVVRIFVVPTFYVHFFFLNFNNHNIPTILSCNGINIKYI